MKSFMDKLKDMLPGSDKEENDAEKADAGTARSAPDPAPPESIGSAHRSAGSSG